MSNWRSIIIERSLAVLFAALGIYVGFHPAGVEARTWYVEKDGSGDFMVIQEAIDAASSGDTIQIGPGRFTEYRWHTPNALIHYNQVFSKSLTFIGAGAGETIIGHEDEMFADYVVGVGIIIMGDVSLTRVSQIGFDMPDLIGQGIYNDNCERIEVERCRFTRCDRGGVFTIAPGGGYVRNCEFRDIDVDIEAGGVAMDLYTPVNGFVVSQCTFDDCFQGFGAFWSGCDNIVVENCHFTGGRAGAGFVDGASGVIRNCDFSGQDTWGIYTAEPGTVIVEDNTISQVGGGPIANGIGITDGPGTVIIRNNIIESDATCLRVLTPFVELGV